MKIIVIITSKPLYKSVRRPFDDKLHLIHEAPTDIIEIVAF